MTFRRAALCVFFWMGAAACDHQTVLKIDVTGDQAYNDVSLRISVTGSSDKTFTGVTFGPTTTFKAGLFLPSDAGGALQVVGEATNGPCVVGRSASVPAAANAAQPVALEIVAVAGCPAPSDGGIDGTARDTSADTNGTGGAGTGTGGRAGTGGGGAGSGGRAGSGGGAGSGGASGSGGVVGSGGNGSGGIGSGGVGSGGSSSGGRTGSGGGTGTGGAGTGGRGTGGAPGTGGTASGGMGGRGSGGSATGGMGSGGMGTGGMGTGGMPGSGGMGMGGAGTGGGSAGSGPGGSGGTAGAGGDGLGGLGGLGDGGFGGTEASVHFVRSPARRPGLAATKVAPEKIVAEGNGPARSTGDIAGALRGPRGLGRLTR